MNLRQIEIFSAIMRTGSVTEAARALNISQPSASISLKYTEDKLGFALFKRSSGRLYPTPEAKILYSECSIVHDHLGRLRQLSFELKHATPGQLRIGCPPALAQNILPSTIDKFRDTNLKTRLHLTVNRLPAVREAVVERQVDLNIAYFPVSDPEIEAMVLDLGQMVCVVSRTHELAHKNRLNHADLEHQNLIRCFSDMEFESLVDKSLPGFWEKSPPNFDVNSFSLAINIAAQGRGVALVDGFAVVGHNRNDLVVIPFEPGIPVSIGVIYPKFEPLSIAAEQFIDCLKETLNQYKIRP